MVKRCSGKHNWVDAGYGNVKCVNCPKRMKRETLDKLAAARRMAALVNMIRKQEQN